jgi:thiol-disulfide isomerase/thioredoxin
MIPGALRRGALAAAFVALAIGAPLAPTPASAQGVEGSVGVEDLSPEGREGRTQRRRARPGWLGVLMDGSTQGDGVRVKTVLRSSPAASAGLERDDRIVEVDGAEVAYASELKRALKKRRAGQKVRFVVVRDDEKRTIEVELGAFPGRKKLLESQLVGREAPGMPLEMIAPEDREIDALADLRGTPVIIEFWATWCGPCKVTGRMLDRLHSKLGDRARIVGVSSEQRSTIDEALEREPRRYMIARDKKDVADSRYFVSSYPTLLVLDASGVVRSVHLGTHGVQAAYKSVEKLLAEDSDENDAASSGEESADEEPSSEDSSHDDEKRGGDSGRGGAEKSDGGD